MYWPFLSCGPSYCQHWKKPPAHPTFILINKLFDITAPPLYAGIRCSFCPSAPTAAFFPSTNPQESPLGTQGATAQGAGHSQAQTPHGARTDSILLRRFCTTTADCACNPSLWGGEKKAVCSKNTFCSSVWPVPGADAPHSVSSPPCHFSRMKHICCNKYIEDLFLSKAVLIPEPSKVRGLLSKSADVFRTGCFFSVQIINPPFSSIQQDWGPACLKRGITHHSSSWLLPAAHVVRSVLLSHCPLNN